MLKNVCVFCGAHPGEDPAYRAAAETLGELLGSSGRRLIYGGGGIGMMGFVADATLRAGGEVIGVIPEHLATREVAHAGLTELCVVGSMHERKQTMASLADGFVVLPGGLGTLEEFFEIWTWGQLGLHRKPYGLLDVAGYFRHLLGFLAHAVEQRFIRREHRELVLVDETPKELLERLDTHRPPSAPRWIEPSTT